LHEAKGSGFENENKKKIIQMMKVSLHDKSLYEN
jgi:hypothetical protein